MADFQKFVTSQNLKTVVINCGRQFSYHKFKTFWVFVTESWKVAYSGVRFIRNFTKIGLLMPEGLMAETYSLDCSKVFSGPEVWDKYTTVFNSRVDQWND